MASEQVTSTQPIHEVNVPSFAIMKTEVTVRMYRKCVESNGCTEPPNNEFCNWGYMDREDHPINCIDWFQAMEFASWVGARLPTEAEWEYVARGEGGDVMYPWGNDFDATMCNTREEGPGHLAPVDYYSEGASPYGVMDMAGNASEWCSDWHKKGYVENLLPNPTGPQTGKHRVTRGSSWRYSANMARCAARYWCPPDMRRNNTGIRLVRI